MLTTNESSFSSFNFSTTSATYTTTQTSTESISFDFFSLYEILLIFGSSGVLLILLFFVIFCQSSSDDSNDHVTIVEVDIEEGRGFSNPEEVDAEADDPPSWSDLSDVMNFYDDYPILLENEISISSSELLLPPPPEYESSD